MLCVAIYLKTRFCVSHKQRIGRVLNLEMFSSSRWDKEFDLSVVDARYLATAELIVNIQEQEGRGILSIIIFDKSITQPKVTNSHPKHLKSISNVCTLLILSNKQSKIQSYSIYNIMKQTEAKDHHIWGTTIHIFVTIAIWNEWPWYVFLLFDWLILCLAKVNYLCSCNCWGSYRM